MGTWLARMSDQTKRAVFGGLFVLCALLGLFPPFYLAASRVDPKILGMPLSVFYMVATGFLITISVCLLYLVERARQEID